MRNFPKTDLDNVDRFVEEHGQDVRYCGKWRKWVVWDGARWIVDAEAEVDRRAEQTVIGRSNKTCF